MNSFVWPKSVREARALMLLKSENSSLELSTDWQVRLLVNYETYFTERRCFELQVSGLLDLFHLSSVHMLANTERNILLLLLLFRNAFFTVHENLLNHFLRQGCKVKLEVARSFSRIGFHELTYNSDLFWCKFWEMVDKKLCLLIRYFVSLNS